MRVYLRMIAATCLLGLSGLNCASIAEAAPIQFRMIGTIEVEFQVGPLPPGIFEGAPFEAILSYDSTIADGQPDDPQRGLYVPIPPNTDENFLFIRAGTSEIRSKGLSLWVGNDVDDVQELFEVPDDTFRSLGSEFTANFDFVFTKLVFIWNDPTRQVFSSDELPTILDAQSFSNPFIEITTIALDPRIHQFTVHALVNSIEIIPEPATFVHSISAISIIATCTGIRRFRRVDRHVTCV